jgi:hypothetical protein
MPVGYSKVKDWKGVNLTDPATEIGDDELAWARNCWSKSRGYITPRPVQRVYEKLRNSGTGLFDVETALTGLYFPNPDDRAFEAGLYNFIDAKGAHHVIMYVPFVGGSGGVGAANEPLAVFCRTTAGFLGLSDTPVIMLPDRPLNAGLSSVLAVTEPRRPVSLVYNNELYLFLGHTYAGLVLGADDFTKGAQGGQVRFRELGKEWASASGTTADRFKFAFGDVYRNVFVLGGLPAPYESLLAFTETGDTPDTLLTPAKWAGIGFGDGDKLLRAVTVPIIGGSDAVEPYVLAMKQRSIWLVQGIPPSSTDSGDMRVSPVMRREGLVAPHAVCNTPYGTAWCSGRNVYLMPPGTEPKPIGDKIKGFLEKLPQQPVDAWWMEYHDDVLYLNFPSPQGLTTGTKYGAANSAGQARTYLASQQFWCDLRKPDEPRWWGPMDVRASHMLSLGMPDGPRQVMGITPFWNTDDRYVIQPFTLAESGIDAQDSTTGATEARGYDLQDPGNFNASGIAGYDLNTPPSSVQQDVRFREMDFGDDDLEKIIEAVELNATWDIGLGALAVAAAGDSPFSMRWIGNGGRNVLSTSPAGTPTGTFTQSDPSSVGFTIDFNKLSGGGALSVPLSETYIPVVAFPVSGSRYLARTFQLQLYSIQVPTVNPYTSTDDLRMRRFSLKSLTIRARPIGRRPGGSYGG